MATNQIPHGAIEPVIQDGQFQFVRFPYHDEPGFFIQHRRLNSQWWDETRVSKTLMQATWDSIVARGTVVSQP